MFLQRATSYTRYNDRMNITPPLTHTRLHIPLLSRFIVNVTHQHYNDRTLQAIYYHAYYLVGILAFLFFYNLLQIGLVFRCCHLKQLFYMGVGQYRLMP